ncbi:MAG TPA: SsgA family sporulation/cell division regulator [Actinophytocola sp.]|uniref:SsgA family sporulation/cell division regulator n=1 Tax=Actinophytocola sp. TaxID=1872138 RepID=UPI002DBF7E1C|nr:SsgA family sporulation/cell division regulator [Actinophytocola sp.]HEU5473923.1 SsgA family sporulation/cell division regulator [Actinophytocola sp.]
MTADSVYTREIVALADDLPVRSRWTYRADDPFTIRVAFQTDHDSWVEWVFARDLLVNGLTGSAGIGDVRLRPKRTEGRTMLQLEIESPEGHALLELERESVQLFLEATVLMVPLGQESNHFDIDGLIDEITNV